MWQKISVLWNLFRKGEEVAKPGGWHDAHNIAVFLLALLAVLKVVLGIELPFDLPEEDAEKIGLGLVVALGWLVNNVASKRGGVLPARQSAAPAVPGIEPGEADAALPPVAEAAAAGSGIDSDTRQRAAEFVRAHARQLGSGG